VKILDRYIARQYLINCVILLAVLCAMVVMVDLFLNLDRYSNKLVELQAMANGVPEEEMHLGPLEMTLGVTGLVADFWGPQLLRLISYLLGTVLVAGMGFTFSQMARKRELTAVLASGVSLPRLALPVVIVASIACCAQLVSQEVLVPRYKHLIARGHGEIGERNLEAFRVPSTPDGQGRLISARRFDDRHSELIDLLVIERGENGVMQAVLQADAAVWDGAGWVLTGGIRQPVPLPGGGVSDARPESVGRLVTDLDPDALLIRKHQALRSMLSWEEISRIITRGGSVDESIRVQLDRYRWGRLAMLVNNVLQLLILIPFFLVREPRNMAAQAVKSVPVGMVAGLIAMMGVMVDLQPIPAAFGVWVSSLVLAPIALGSWTLVRT
jgi:lipopolysaccharide export LptBFGC system permease protein LptF